MTFESLKSSVVGKHPSLGFSRTSPPDPARSETTTTTTTTATTTSSSSPLSGATLVSSHHGRASGRQSPEQGHGRLGIANPIVQIGQVFADPYQPEQSDAIEPQSIYGSQEDDALYHTNALSNNEQSSSSDIPIDMNDGGPFSVDRYPPYPRSPTLLSHLSVDEVVRDMLGDEVSTTESESDTWTTSSASSASNEDATWDNFRADLLPFANADMPKRTEAALKVFGNALHDYFNLAPYVLTPAHLDLSDEHALHMEKMDRCLRTMSDAYTRAQSKLDEGQLEHVSQQVSELVKDYAVAMPPSLFAKMLAASGYSVPDTASFGVTPDALALARYNAPMAWHNVLTSEFAKMAGNAPEKLAQALSELNAKPANNAAASSNRERVYRVVEPFSRVAKRWPNIDWHPAPKTVLLAFPEALSARGNGALEDLQNDVASRFFQPDLVWYEEAQKLVLGHLQANADEVRSQHSAIEALRNVEPNFMDDQRDDR